MSDCVEGQSHCETVQGDLPELAFGALSGRRPSEVLGHVGFCPHCSADLEQRVHGRIWRLRSAVDVSHAPGTIGSANCVERYHSCERAARDVIGA